jgi:hypothetical protein
MRLFRTKNKPAQVDRGQRKKDSQPPSRRKILFEAMEPRVLLSGDPNGTLAGGVLTGNLSSGADAVVVALSSINGGTAADGGLIIDLTVNGNLQTFGTAAVGVQSIALDGLAGNDSFRIASVLTKPLTIHGGEDSDTLIGPDGTMAWTISGADAGSATGITAFDGVENLSGRNGADQFTLLTGGSISGQIDGGDGNDTLIGTNADTSWVVSGNGSGMVDGSTHFVAIESLTGGTGADKFAVQTIDALSGTIDGGAGIDSLVGPDAASTWTLTGPGAGTLNTTAFAHLENLTGGNADDSFAVVGATASLAGTLDGGLFDDTAPTVNTLDFSQRGAAVSVNLETSSASGMAVFSRITSVVGSSATDTLTGPVALLDHTSWDITGTNAGVVDGTTFAGFENLTGQGSTSDAFIFEAGATVSGTIAGGSGAGAIDGFGARQAGGAVLAFQPVGADAAGTSSATGPSVTYTGMDNFNPVSGDDTNRVFTGSIFDSDFTLAAAGPGQMTVSFSNLSFTTGPSSYTFNTPTGSLSLVAGTGADQITVASLDPAFGGALVRNAGGALTADLRGGADTAAVAFVAASNDQAVKVQLTVNGFAQTYGSIGAGIAHIALDGKGGADTFQVDQVMPIEITIVGGTGIDTVVGPILGMQWDLTGPDSGSAEGITSFTEIENLTGRGGADRFNVRTDAGVTGSLSGQIDGGAGLDELIGPDATSSWSLTGADAGVLNSNVHYVGVESLLGGNAADTFHVQAAGSVSGTVDGGLVDANAPAVNTLDFAGRGSAVSVDLALANASGITAFTRIDAVVGSSLSGDTLTGPGATDDHIAWNITGANAGDVAGTAFSGSEWRAA